MFTVYVARNTVNGKRYIGFTRKGMPHRRLVHLSNARQGRKGSRLYDAIRKHGADKFRWSVAAEYKSEAEALDCEYRLVAYLCPEYNAMPGGMMGPISVAWNKRPVICLDDGIVFDSATAAAVHYQACNSEISRACKKGSTVFGRHFQIYGAPLSEDECKTLITSLDAEVVKKRARGRTAPILPPTHGGKDRLGRSAAGPMSNARPVICLEDGRSFESASAAAHHYGVCRSAVIELCRGQKFRQTVGGKRFAYVETP